MTLYKKEKVLLGLSGVRIHDAVPVIPADQARDSTGGHDHSAFSAMEAQTAAHTAYTLGIFVTPPLA